MISILENMSRMATDLSKMSMISDSDSLKPSQSVAFGVVEEVEFEKATRPAKASQGMI